MKKITVVWIILGLAAAPLANSAARQDNEGSAVPSGLEDTEGVSPKEAEKLAKKEAKRIAKEEKAAVEAAEKAEKAARKQAEREAKEVEEQLEKARKVAEKEAETAREQAEKVRREAEKAEKEALKRAEKEARRAEKHKPKLTRAERLFQQRQVRLASQVAELNQLSQQEEVEEGIFQSIRREHGISSKRLKKQIEDNPGLGVGDLLVANLIARTVHKPIEEVVAEQKSGRNWAEIAEENKINLPTLIEKTYKVGIFARAMVQSGSQEG